MGPHGSRISRRIRMNVLSQLQTIASCRSSFGLGLPLLGLHEAIVDAYRKAFTKTEMTAKQVKSNLETDTSNVPFRLRKLEGLGYIKRDGKVAGTKTIRWTWIEGK